MRAFFIAAAAVATLAGSPVRAADAPGACSYPLFITTLGGFDHLTVMRDIDSKCRPGDKITLPKRESYLVGEACDLAKPVVDLGPRVMCLLRDPNPKAAPRRRS